MIHIKLDLQDAQAVKQAIQTTSTVLKAHGLVIYPTETVYGIGADAQSSQAVDKLLDYKGRREGKPLSIAVSSQEMAEQYVKINEQALKFYQHFLPGPFTVVSKSKGKVDNRVESEFGTLGIRIPDYPLIVDIVRNFDSAITSTSANASGKKRPYSINDILTNLSAKQQSLIDLIIDVGTLPDREPSVVVDTTLSTPIALRGELQDQSAKAQQLLLSDSVADTMGLAGRLLLNHWNAILQTGLIIGLNGDLGMGKTIFTKGVAEFLKIEQAITSPTYSYMNEYDFRRGQTVGKLYHIDAWKIDHPDELALLNLDDLIKENNIVVVEWFSQIKNYLKPQRAALLEISFSKTDDLRDDRRQIKISIDL